MAAPSQKSAMPLHLAQIAHIVRLICDARLPLHLGRKTFPPLDDAGLRVASVRVFPEVESDVTAYLSHFRSPLYLCIGKPTCKPSHPSHAQFSHPGQAPPHPVRWPSTESDDQPYDMALLEVWCIKFSSPQPSGMRGFQPLASPRDICCLGRTLCAMLRLMPLFCSSDRSELHYILSTAVPLTSTQPSLKDAFDFGAAVDTDGGKLSVTVQFSRPAPRTVPRTSPSISSLSLAPAPSPATATATATASGASSTAARPPSHPSDARDSKISPPVAMPPKRHSLSPCSAPEPAPISSGSRRNSLQPNPSPVGSLDAPGSFGGGSRIFSPAVPVRYAGSSQQASSSSATAARAPPVPSNQHVDPVSAAAVAASLTAPSPPQYALASSMALNASSIGVSSSYPALSAGIAASSVDLLHTHTPRLAFAEMGAGGSVSRTSSAGSLGATQSRELHPLSLAWEGGGTSSAKATSSASQGAGDNPFMMADDSDDDDAGLGGLDDDVDGLSDSTFRGFGAPPLKLAFATGHALSMQDVLELAGTKGGKLDLQLERCEMLCKDLQHAAH